MVPWVLLVLVVFWGLVGLPEMPKRKDPEIPVRVATAVVLVEVRNRLRVRVLLLLYAPHLELESVLLNEGDEVGRDRVHAELLLKVVKWLLRDSKCSLREIRAIAVVPKDELYV